LTFIFLSFHQAFFETLSGVGVACFTTGRRKFSIKVFPLFKFCFKHEAFFEKSEDLCQKLAETLA
jgi:hypothetical protein